MKFLYYSFSPGWGDCIPKWWGCSLSPLGGGVNFAFDLTQNVLGKTLSYAALLGFCANKYTKLIHLFNVLIIVSFMGQKILGHAMIGPFHDWSPLGP